jgi:hypothetical protein
VARMFYAGSGQGAKDFASVEKIKLPVQVVDDLWPTQTLVLDRLLQGKVCRMEADQTVAQWPLLHRLVHDHLLREYCELQPVLKPQSSCSCQNVEEKSLTQLLVKVSAESTTTQLQEMTDPVEFSYFRHDLSHRLASSFPLHCAYSNDNLQLRIQSTDARFSGSRKKDSPSYALLRADLRRVAYSARQ